MGRGLVFSIDYRNVWRAGGGVGGCGFFWDSGIVSRHGRCDNGWEVAKSIRVQIKEDHTSDFGIWGGVSAVPVGGKRFGSGSW